MHTFSCQLWNRLHRAQFVKRIPGRKTPKMELAGRYIPSHTLRDSHGHPQIIYTYSSFSISAD